jgi:hypothetical protein
MVKWSAYIGQVSSSDVTSAAYRAERGDDHGRGHLGLDECLVFAVPRGPSDPRACPSGVELAPARPDLLAVTADDPSGIIQGLAGQRQRGRVEQHLEPLGGRCRSWSIASSTRGSAMPQADAPYLIRTSALRSRNKDEKAHCQK